MLRIKKSKKIGMTELVKGGSIFALVLCFSAAINAQTGSETQTAAMQTQSESPSVPVAAPAPVLESYQNIKIGTSADAVRKQLGKAEIDDKDGFYYEISRDEIVQIRLDENKNVRLIITTYSGKNKHIPTFVDVFGSGIQPEPGVDGRIYNLVRYPETGYWVAYSQTGGDQPTVTVTIQKL